MSDELTPSERAALRSRIVGGARDIKPVGAHRNAWIAGSVAAVLVAAIAGGVVATSTLSAPQIANTPSPTATAAPVVPSPAPSATPTRTPTPEPTASTPVVAFGGDCGQALTDAEAGELLIGDGAAQITRQQLASDAAGSLALLGGVQCVWASEGDALTVVVAAAGAVDPDLISSLSSVQCSIEDGCSMARVEGDIWVGAVLSAYPDSAGAGFTPEQTAALASRLDRALSRVAAKPHVSPVSTIGSIRSGRWRLADCESLQGALERVTGTPLTAKPRDGESLLPIGLAARVIASSAQVTSCAYSDVAEGSRGSIVVTLMPGASTPPPSSLDLAETSETTVVGADQAWVQVAYDHVYVADLVATVGDDRLALRRMTSAPAVTDAEQIAAAVLASLR